MSAPSLVRTVLALMPMRRTSPINSPSWMVSPHLDGPFEEKDQAAHEIVHDALKAKTDAHAEGADHHCDAIQVYAECRHGQHEADSQYQIMDETGDRERHSRRKTHRRVDVFFEDEADEGGEQIRDPQRGNEGDHFTGGNARGAQLELGGEQVSCQRLRGLEQTHVIEGSACPRR